MQKYNITVSPDFKPDKIASWYVFNTCFQKAAELSLHLALYNDFDELRDAIREEKVDLIYANPYDAALLVNEHGFLPLVKPVGKSDECVIVTSVDGDIHSIEDLQPESRIATTNDPATNMIGMRMLEAADLDEENTVVEQVVSFVVVARQVMTDKADIGFFLKEAYDELSDMIKNRLRVVASSEISVIYHALMVGPKLADQRERLTQILLNMNKEEKSQAILKDLGLNAWEEMTDEDAAFMIDLMETLRS